MGRGPSPDVTKCSKEENCPILGPTKLRAPLNPVDPTDKSIILF